jgi:transposase
MFATNSFLRSLGVEVYASGHRRWPDDVKAQVVADTLAPGTPVKAVAARYGIQPNQLSAWRRLAKQGKLVLPAVAEVARETEEFPTFAPLVLREPENPVERKASPQSEGVLRIAVGAVMLELAADTPARRIAEIVHALGAES